MAIELGYMNLVITIKKIEKYYPGGFDQYKKQRRKNEARQSLVVREAMDMKGIEAFAKECEAFGLVRVVEKDGVKQFKDFCMIDIVPILPCDWLEDGGFEVFDKYKERK